MSSAGPSSAPVPADPDTPDVPQSRSSVFVRSAGDWPSDHPVLVLDVVRDLDGAVARPATRQLTALLDVRHRTHCLILRFLPRVFVDVRGLDVLLGAAARVRERRGLVVLLDPPRCLRRMLDVLDLRSEFTVAPGVAGGPAHP